MNIMKSLDRSRVKELVPRKGRSVLISITSPNSEFVQLHGDWTDVLRLKFDDVEQKDGQDYELFSDIQAKQILDFVIKHLDKDIFVNCDAGLSRSPAVVVALEQIFNANDVSNVSDYQHHNRFVKNKIRDIWFKNIWNPIWEDKRILVKE
ncbi:MAG: dual specificity protein phosphatase family protein [Actinobacteria bacterium]|nr:dual specificity protein phosphatase family protein [Actinomycetota bacterium]MBE3114766.1 dual specificity protein phosphatase family protein [Actinomycetota bacterium]